MNHTSRRSALLALALLGGCTAQTQLAAGLKVVVSVRSSSKAQCVRVLATPDKGTAVPTRAIARKDEIVVAVYRGDDWSGNTSIVARGYASCDDDVPNFIEESAVAVSETLIGDISLVLEGTTPVVDKDGDGKGGADDCDDSDSERFVGNAELCTSPKDNNCSNTTGCADSACTGACAANGLGTCQAGTCVGSTELSCVDGADNDLDGRIDCLDSDCTSSSCDDGNACTAQDVCGGDGGCAGPPVQVSCGAAPAGTCLFGAGSCNPADGGCLYRARDAGLSCTDFNGCTIGDVCLGDGGCNPGAPRVCSSPGANVCLSANGTCSPADGGCSYPPATGNTCNDTFACTDNDVCLADAGCRGTPRVCFQTTNPCKLDAGSCNSGVCTYPNRQNGTACDDGNACTVTSCDTGACTVDSNVTCTAMDICHDAGTCMPATGCSNPTAPCIPNECQTGGTCTAPTGCSFTNKANTTPCAGGNGQCMSGVCQLNFLPFDRYNESNFDSTTASPTTSVTINCAAVFNTGTSTTQAGFTGCNGQTLTQSGGGVQIITQQNSTLPAALIRLSSLTITDGGSLTIQGDRPAILAVYGNAHLGGTVRLSANLATKGPGSELGCADRSMMNGGANGGDGSGGAGGAGHAAAGASGSKGDNYGAGIGAGQAQSGNITLTPLRGGCAGGLGGGTAGGVGGGGGGALQISASRQLRIVGTIHANGGGGQGGTSNIAGVGEGGGGGGSAGGLLLEADTFTIESTARIFANGGTGGEGGDATGSGRKANGQNGQLAWGMTPGPGDDMNGANGGPGGGGTDITPTTPAPAQNTSPGGGGGGGGAAGRIYLRFTNTNTSCRETGYILSPSSADTTGGVSANDLGFATSRNLPNAVTKCP